MALRAFKTTFLVAIDDESIEIDDRAEELGPVSLEELKEYLNSALRVDWDNESEGDPCGVQSMEVLIEGLTELSPDEVAKLYTRK